VGDSLGGLFGFGLCWFSISDSNREGKGFGDV
jgi:hypothetical protein